MSVKAVKCHLCFKSLFIFFFYSYSRIKVWLTSQCECVILFCFLRIFLMKYRWCVVFWRQRLTLHSTRFYVLAYTLSNPTGNCIFTIHCAWDYFQQSEIFQTILHTQTLLGTLSPWTNKSNIQPPLVRIRNLVVRLTIRHSEKMSHNNNNNSLLILTDWETNYAPFILTGEYSRK
jgi:hypothetical protein